jgi:hypothetical protein
MARRMAGVRRHPGTGNAAISRPAGVPATGLAVNDGAYGSAAEVVIVGYVADDDN